MIELSIKDFLALFGALGGGLGAYFLLRGRVASLEKDVRKLEDLPERLVKLEARWDSLESEIKRIFNSLQRIESKLDDKADK